MPKSRARIFRSVNAMLGMMSHFDTYKLRRELFDTPHFNTIGYFNDDYSVYYLKQ